MKLAICGSTGGTGRQLVAQALEQGHDVTAFARTPEKLSPGYSNLKIVEGDVLDISAVERAVAGQDAVLCALGQSALIDKSRLRANGTKNIIRAMEKNGIKRFICQSSLGIGNSRNLLPFQYKYCIVPLLLRHVFADHELQENHIRGSSLDWIIVRPGVLTDGEHTGTYQHGFSIDNKTVTIKISRADTADFMLRQLAENNYLHKMPCVSY